MKKNNILKAFALSMIMILGLVMPMTAQNSDYFFKGNNEDIYGNRDGGDDPTTNITGGGITNQTFGAPLGSGLLIMVAAGAGYVALKKKED